MPHSQHETTSDSQLDLEKVCSLKPVHISSTDLDIPIAIRKGVRRCTQHPLANYLSYHKLSPRHRSFLTALDTIVIPNSKEKALKDKKWELAM